VGSKKGQAQSFGGGNIQITLSSDAAKELLQALTATLGGGGGKGKATYTGKPKASAKAKPKP
jgi:hypothetical protein